MSYPTWVYTLFAFISFILCCIPFPWHFQAWNTGTCLFMAWVGLMNLLQGINSIIWYNNAINWAPVWCDITARFFIGANLAIPACGLCITRRLYHIAYKPAVKILKGEKRRQVMIDLVIGLGLPIIFMILQYIPQGHRFNIFEEVGCQPATYNTWVAIAVVNVPPLVAGLISAVYGVLSIIAFNKVRRQNKEIFSQYSNLNTSRYLRLMALAATDLACSVPISIYIIYLNIAKIGLSPWISWEDTHFDFSRVAQLPSIFWHSDWQTELSFELPRWIPVLSAFLFFLFFGFAEEARKNYRSFIRQVSKRTRASVGKLGKSGSTSSSAEVPRSGINPDPAATLELTMKTPENNKNGTLTGTSSTILKDAPCTIPVYKEMVPSLADVPSGKNKSTDPDVSEPSFHSDGAFAVSNISGNLADNPATEILNLQVSGPSCSALSIQIPDGPSEQSASRLVDRNFQRDLYNMV